MDEEPVCNAMAGTNTFSWEVDDYEIQSFEVDGDFVLVKVAFSCSGEVDQDKPFCGDKIDGRAVAWIDENGDVSFEDVCAKVEDWSD